MGTVNVNLGEASKLNLILGQQLENAVTSVVFDFSAWQTAYGSGTLGLSVQRPGDAQPYAVVMTVSGTNATWSITSLDTAYKGVGEIQVTYTVGSVVKKSVVYKFTVYKSLGENGEYPSPGQSWQEEIEDELADVKQNLEYILPSITDVVDDNLLVYDHTNSSSSGVSFTWDTSTHVCTVTGTATSDRVNNIQGSTRIVPSWWEADTLYDLIIDSTDTNIKVNIFIRTSSGDQATSYDKTTTIRTPKETATGVIVRLFVASGSSVNGTIKVTIKKRNLSKIDLDTRIALLESKTNGSPTNMSVDAQITKNSSASSDTYNGITWTKVTDYSWTASGTATTTNGSFRNIVGATGYLDAQFIRGQWITLNIEADYGIGLQVINFLTGGTSTADFYTSTTDIQIPINATAVLIRLLVPSGVTVNGAINFSIIGHYNSNLESTNDTSARTSEIIKLLTLIGSVHLNNGLYCSGSISMASGSAIRGDGYCTELRLIDDGTNNEQKLIVLASNCTVENLRLTGGDSDITLPNSIGVKHGIYFSSTSVKQILLNNLFIERFVGGGITLLNTGYDIDSSICANNLWVRNCYAGINIDVFSEFNRFSNFNIHGCAVGIINNGGNNMFSNGSISGNKIGFLLDNSNDDKNNNAHGSMVGCNINHSDNNDGYGIVIRGSFAGYIFTACQLYYSAIEVTNSSGIIFDHCNFGNGNVIEITSGGLVMFDGCISSNTEPNPTITGNTHVKFLNCSTKSGTDWSFA